MKEIEVQDAIAELAHLFEWRVAAFRPARTKHGWRTPVSYDGKGWPDMHLSHVRVGSLYREIKTATGKLSDEQLEWGEHLLACGLDYKVWRPADAVEIARTLSFGRVTDWTL